MDTASQVEAEPDFPLANIIRQARMAQRNSAGLHLRLFLSGRHGGMSALESRSEGTIPGIKLDAPAPDSDGPQLPHDGDMQILVKDRLERMVRSYGQPKTRLFLTAIR